jgi:hypothetical protein
VLQPSFGLIAAREAVADADVEWVAELRFVPIGVTTRVRAGWFTSP